MEKIEIELKFPLRNFEALLKRLDKIASFKGEDNQKDTYFIPPHRNFIKQNPIFEWLRIREINKEDGKVSILNYKNFGKDKKAETISCKELETEFENSEILRSIFKNLDISEIIVVDKKRRNYSYRDTIISIDKVSELGIFIEIEFDGITESEDKAKEHLYNVLKEIEADVDEPVFKGYPHLLLEKQGYFNGEKED